MEEYRLFRGGSFFNDGIAGYPLECHVPDLYNSFGPAHPVVETIMCFSTNCLFCEAYRIYSEMSAHFGDEAAAKEAMAYHDELKDTVNRVFWDEDLGRYRYILYPDGHMDDSQEASGHAFAVLFDICPKEKQAALLENLTYSDRGMVSVWLADRYVGNTLSDLSRVTYAETDGDGESTADVLAVPADTREGADGVISETEPYYILSGTGIFTDSDKSETTVTAGDICQIKCGEWHALRNAGDDDLVLIALVYYERGREE